MAKHKTDGYVAFMKKDATYIIFPDSVNSTTTTERHSSIFQDENIRRQRINELTDNTTGE
jgi:hypothetical protein